MASFFVLAADAASEMTSAWQCAEDDVSSAAAEAAAAVAEALRISIPEWRPDWPPLHLEAWQECIASAIVASYINC